MVGFKQRRFQLVFADDPRMTPYWLEWAKKGAHPIARVGVSPDGAEACVCEFNLERE